MCLGPDRERVAVLGSARSLAPPPASGRVRPQWRKDITHGERLGYRNATRFRSRGGTRWHDRIRVWRPRRAGHRFGERLSHKRSPLLETHNQPRHPANFGDLADVCAAASPEFGPGLLLSTMRSPTWISRPSSGQWVGSRRKAGRGSLAQTSFPRRELKRLPPRRREAARGSYPKDGSPHWQAIRRWAVLGSNQ
jgi:hypothetical protein